MNIREILARVDHTLLDPAASWADVKEVCDDGIRYRTASVCIPPSYVRQAAEYAGGRVKICTVAGFPNGYATTASKCFEASDASRNGADEIDMVINIGRLKEGDHRFVLDEIRAVREACPEKILKVIVETCLLTEEEKADVCGLVVQSGADYIKTSTGFSVSGAARGDVELFARHTGGRIGIKAAGGIRTLEDAEDFIRLGASRLGTSRIVNLVKGDAELNKIFADEL